MMHATQTNAILMIDDVCNTDQRNAHPLPISSIPPPGTLVIESVDKEENEAAADGVIEAFKSLPTRSQSSVAQQITMLIVRCKAALAEWQARSPGPRAGRLLLRLRLVR